jgi:hypothetical protein
MANTGFKFPTSTGFNIQGNPYNTWTSPTNAYADDGSYTTVIETASSLRQSYGDFDFNIPATNIIVGVEMKMEAKCSNASGILNFRSGPNYDGTTLLPSYTSLTTSDAVYTWGGSTNNLGFTTGSQFANGSFWISVYPPGNNTSYEYSIDYIKVDVYHTPPGGLLMWFN